VGHGVRRALAAGLVGLAVLPVSLLAGCGNQARQQSGDHRPDPRASTEGARIETPQPASQLPSAGATVQPQTPLGPAGGSDTSQNR